MNSANEALIASQPINYIHTLHEVLEHRQEHVPLPYLMGISGEAFRFFYNRLEPEAGMNAFFHNPLRMTCKALGLDHEVLYDETYQNACERLRENMRAGKPALLPFPGSCPFLTEGDRPETVICQNGSRYKLNTGDLHTQWQAGGGFLELGPHGYYQFVIGDREREPKEREIALGTFRCARKLMRTRRRVHDCAVGLAAYEELISHLNSLVSRKRKLSEREVYKVAQWNGQPLLQCLEGRKAAVEYLQLVRKHFEGEELTHLDKAIVAYQTVVSLLRGLRTILPSASQLQTDLQTPSRPDSHYSQICDRINAEKQAKTHQEVMKRFKPRCRAAIKLLEKILGAETAGIDALENVVQISEKVKM